MDAGSEYPAFVLARGRSRTTDVEAEHRAYAARRCRRTFLSSVLTGVGILVVLIGLLRPYFTRGHHGYHHRASCKSCLRNIGLGCHLYADEHDGAFPDSLEQLVPEFIDNPQVFSCPESPSSWEDFNSGNVTEASSSYRLVSGLRADMPGSFILVYEKTSKNHEGDGRNVCFLDGHVEWWPAGRDGEFTARYIKQRKAARAFLEAMTE